MGWRFSLKYSNIIAYILSTSDSPIPRITDKDLWEFLGSLSIGDDLLISADTRWIREIKTIASKAQEKLGYMSGIEFLEKEKIEDVLLNLRYKLGRYRLIGLAVGLHKDKQKLDTFFQYAAISSDLRIQKKEPIDPFCHNHFLFLMPELPCSTDSICEILDPFPSVAKLAEDPASWPGILFWSNTGKSAFVPLEEAPKLYEDLIDILNNEQQDVDTMLESYRLKKTSKKIMHLSDLHFGSRDALKNRSYLTACMENILPKVDRIVITGDLLDNPNGDAGIHCRDFVQMLHHSFGKEPIIVPGNHDQRVLGNIGENLREIVRLEISTLVIDDDMQCIFFCFDSSRDANLAKGRVNRDQLRDIASRYETTASTVPQIRDYLSVALIHHHPFSFVEKKNGWINRFIANVHEQFLRMDDAESFLKWCASRKVSLILHGHKHIQRYVSEDILIQRGDKRELCNITAVGCGASLGILNAPLSYNILSWDPASKQWGATFWSDPGDGSGFTRQCIALHTAQNKE